MYKKIKILAITAVIMSLFLCFNVFASNSDNLESLLEKIDNNAYTGTIYSPAASAKSFGNQVGDDWGYSTSKISKPTWFKYGNKYYLVLESESDKYENEDGKKLSLYAINEYISEDVAVIKDGNIYKAYYFDDNGVCSSAITNEDGRTIIFNKDGTVKSGLDDIEDEEIDMKVYETGDFYEKKVGRLTETKYLMNGYFLFKDGDGLYLYKASSTGTASKKATGKTKILTYIEKYDVYNNIAEEKEKKSSTKTYTVKFNGGSGAKGTMTSLTIEKGKKLTLPECKFTKTGYTFSYWKIGNSSTKYYPGKTLTISGNKTFTAYWNKN